MVYAPQRQSGNFFNRQERNVRSLQLVEALTFSKDDWLGQHVFKVGIDLQHSRFDGDNYSQEVDVVRLDGSLAERTTYSPPLTQPGSQRHRVRGVRAGSLARQRSAESSSWASASDRDDVVERVNYSPRVGMSVSVLPEGRGILRGGFGKFAERTPLTVGAFTQYDVQTVSRFAADGTPLGAPVTFAHVVDGTLKTPESIVQTVAWDQRFGRRFFFKAAYLHRNGSHAYTSIRIRAAALLTLASTGESKYWELETTGRYLASEHRDLTRVVRAVAQHARSQRLRPVLRQLQESDHPAERELAEPDRRAQPADRPRHDRPARASGCSRRSTSGGPGSRGRRSNEFQDSSATRNESGRLPTVSTLDFTLARPWQFRKYRFTGGIKIYNAFDTGNERDVQNNITSPDYGKFYNPIQRSIGFVVGPSRK